MDRDTQEKLSRYTKGDRKLLVIGDLPQLDGEFGECGILRKLNGTVTVISREEFYEKNIVDKLVDLGLTKSVITKDSSLIWLYFHPDRDIQYLFVLTSRDHIGQIEFEYESLNGSKQVELRLPPASGGVVRVVDGSLSAALLKGVNDYLEESETPYCTINGNTLSADRPCDLLITQVGDSYVVRTVSDPGSDINVELPNGEVRTCKVE